MVIYDSTNSSSALHLILSSVLPNRHRVRVTSQMDSMVTSKATAVSGTSFGKTALTWTACVGLSLILLQYVGSRREKGIADGNEEDSAGSVGIGPGTLYQFVFEQLSRLRYWIISSSDRDDYDRDEDLDGESLVVHQGSCHCGAVAFEVRPWRGFFANGDVLCYVSRRISHYSSFCFCHRFRRPVYCMYKNSRGSSCTPVFVYQRVPFVC